MNAPTPRNQNRTPAIQVKGSGKVTDTQDIDTGGLDKSITLEADMSLEELRDSLNAHVSPDVDAPDFKQFAGNIEFMNEEVLVRIIPSAEKSAEQVIDVYNDGIPQRFVRGHWCIAKRKFVEVLARSKPFGVTTPEIIDGNGNRTTAIQLSHGMRYPFEMRDQNPRGQGWLQAILQEA